MLVACHVAMISKFLSSSFIIQESSDSLSVGSRPSIVHGSLHLSCIMDEAAVQEFSNGQRRVRCHV